MMDLTALQRRLGLTQAQFATVLGISTKWLQTVAATPEAASITGAAILAVQAETLERLLKYAVVARKSGE